MYLTERIEALNELGRRIKSRQWLPDYEKIQSLNPWFTPASVDLAIDGILNFLNSSKLLNWCSSYTPINGDPKNVGIIMAGNIPMVGFHDLLCVLMAGHQAQIKLSHQDTELIPSLCDELIDINPGFTSRINFRDHLPELLIGLIATGSDNTARYITYKFDDIPKLIRKNRTSHAILNDSEDQQALHNLGTDIFSYFGRGCRNISKLWVPAGYSFHELINILQANRQNLMIEPYLNNYRYQKAWHLSMGKPFTDLGYALLVESAQTVSPLGVLYYEQYASVNGLMEQLAGISTKLQCTVSDQCWLPGSIAMGSTQCPELPDYADGLDTMNFILSLN